MIVSISRERINVLITGHIFKFIRSYDDKHIFRSKKWSKYALVLLLLVFTFVINASEVYYEDNRDEYDDYDDAYEGFLDDDSAWDDY